MQKFVLIVLLTLIVNQGFSEKRTGVNSGYETDVTDTLKGDVYVLSIGINKYVVAKQEKNFFANSVKDAQLFGDMIAREFQSMHNPRGYKLIRSVLTDEQATKQNIVKQLNEIQKRARANDYFFFSFSGFSLDQKDSLSEEIFFCPYSKEEIPVDLTAKAADNSLNDKRYLSLSSLRDLMEFVEAQNQLIITEAGQSDGFRNILISNLIKNSKQTAFISTRKRVILTPVSYGFDNLICADTTIAHGPFMYYLHASTIPEDVSLFDFFATKKQRDKLEYHLRKQEFGCRQTEPYITFSYEEDILNEYKILYRELKARNRGVTLTTAEDSTLAATQHRGRKYALIIGTNNYKTGKPEWTDLANPIQDAKAMNEILTRSYGYSCKLLQDATAEQFLKNLKFYADSLTGQDQFILYIGGHGLYDPLFFNDGFLVFSNSLPYSKDSTRRTYIPFSQIQNIVDHFKNKHVLMLVDVCYGGRFTMNFAAETYRSSKDVYTDLELKEYLRWKQDLKTRIVITSGSLDVVPDGYEGMYSPFAKRLLSTLNGGGGEKRYLTSMDLYQSLGALKSKPLRGELPSNEIGAEFILIKQ